MKKLWKSIFFVAMLLLLYLPILILAVYSFTDATTIGTIRGFSLQNYVTLFTTEELRTMIFGTLTLAVTSALIATILGSLGAIGAFYSKERVKTAMSTMNQIPVINADVVTGFSICVLMVVVMRISKDTYIPLLIGHVTLSAPFVFLNVMPKIQQMDSSLYEAALDLGATPFRALKQVVIPQIMPGIVSGFGLAITLSLDDYFIATYTKPAMFDTISTYVVNATKGSQTTIKTALWALSTVIFLIVILVVAVGNYRAIQEEKRKEPVHGYTIYILSQVNASIGHAPDSTRHAPDSRRSQPEAARPSRSGLPRTECLPSIARHPRGLRCPEVRRYHHAARLQLGGVHRPGRVER